MTNRGVYVGYNPQDVYEFENWLGDEVDQVLTFLNNDSWAEFTASARWYADDVWPQVDRPVVWSVPLIVNGANLADAAAGAYDGYWRQAAEEIAGTRPQDAAIYVRVGWEFNHDMFPWAAEGQEANYVEAFRGLVDVFRSVSDRFKFEWNVNAGNGGAVIDPADAYPGDAYVDVIGMDFYWGPQWGDSPDPDAAWDWMLNREYGLRWHQDFAAQRGKPTAYSEWGVNSDNGAAYMDKVDAWFDSHDVLYQNYWDSDASFPGRISGGEQGATGEAYRSEFREGGTAGEPPPPPPPPPTDGPSTPPGTGADDLLVGGDAPDLLWTGAGNDTLRGRDGDDSLYGAEGDDRLNGGRGDDWLEGGPGRDTIVWSGGVDGAGGFERGIDRVEIRGQTEDQVTMGAFAHDGTSGWLIRFEAGGHLWLPGVAALDGSDIVFA